MPPKVKIRKANTEESTQFTKKSGKPIAYNYKGIWRQPVSFSDSPKPRRTAIAFWSMAGLLFFTGVIIAYVIHSIAVFILISIFAVLFFLVGMGLMREHKKQLHKGKNKRPRHRQQKNR